MTLYYHITKNLNTLNLSRYIVNILDKTIYYDAIQLCCQVNCFIIYNIRWNVSLICSRADNKYKSAYIYNFVIVNG